MPPMLGMGLIEEFLTPMRDHLLCWSRRVQIVLSRKDRVVRQSHVGLATKHGDI